MPGCETLNPTEFSLPVFLLITCKSKFDETHLGKKRFPWSVIAEEKSHNCEIFPQSGVQKDILTGLAILVL